MFQISGVKTRYFEFEAPDNRKVLLIEPPKLKTLKNLEDVQRNQNASFTDVAAVVAKLMSKNKQQRKITADQVMDWMDVDQMRAFMQAYIGWMRAEKANDPN